MIAAYEESLADSTREFYGILAPPPAPRTILEFAESLKLAEGIQKGKPYDPRSHRPQWVVLNAIMSGKYHRYIVVGPTQDGKTWIVLIIPALYVLCELRQPAIYGCPDMRMANDTWTEKIKPAMIASGLQDFLPKEGIGSSGGTNITTVHLHLGATLFFMGAGGKNESAQASRTACYVFKDELDSIKSSLIPLMDRRADNFDDLARRFETSTIKHDRGSRILMRLEDSTNGHLQFRCVHCRRFQRFQWDGVTYDNVDDVAAKETVRLACKHCGVGMTDSDRQTAIAGDFLEVMAGQTVDETGMVVGDPPRSLNYGIKWTALDSPLKSLGNLAVEHRAACIKAVAGDHEDLRNFYRDQLCEPYTGDLDQTVEISMELIYRRSKQSDYQAGEIADGVQFITGAIDVQLRWLYWCVRGYDMDRRRWLIAAGVESLRHEDGPKKGEPINAKEEPTKGQRWAALDRVSAIMANGWRRGEQHFVPARKALDVGNFMDELRPWLARNPDWTAVVGRGESQVIRQLGATTGNRMIFIPGVVDVRQQSDAYGAWPLWMVDADKVRAGVHDGFLVEPGEPGCGYVFRGIASKSATEWIARHLTGEIRQRDEASGEVTWEKRSADARVDILDTAVYADAMGLAHLEYLRSQQPKAPAPIRQPPAEPNRINPVQRRFSRLDLRRNT